MTLPLDSILQGDCVEILAELPEHSIDLIFADPPYNLQLRQPLLRPNLSLVDAVDDEWDKFADFAAYDRFTREWLRACRRVLKPNGSLWVIGSYHNIFRVGTALQDEGYWILNDVVWIKSNPMPNFRGTRFCNAHETLIWAKTRQEARVTFNYGAMKAANDDLQMRSDWYMPICSGSERLRNGDDESQKVHATQKPEGLLHRILSACTIPGDIVLDPFFGSGTTGAVAKRIGRRYIGIERDAGYVAEAEKRLWEIVRAEDEALVPIGRPNRIPFGALVELGLIEPGARLRLGNREVYAVVRADGTLIAGNRAGSIHRVGAYLLGQSACNGWEHWRYFDSGNGSYRSIDLLRQRARETLGTDGAAILSDIDLAERAVEELELTP